MTSQKCKHPVLIDSQEQPGVDVYVCARCDSVVKLYQYEVERLNDPSACDHAGFIAATRDGDYEWCQNCGHHFKAPWIAGSKS